MPRVEFYVLPDSDPRQRLRVACQLAGKAWRAGMQVFIRGASEQDCDALDDLLWSYRSASFVPHNRHEDGADAPVVIGIDQDPRSEEHTSELQSRPHLVCRLLLEKKNKQTSTLSLQ